MARGQRPPPGGRVPVDPGDGATPYPLEEEGQLEVTYDRHTVFEGIDALANLLGKGRGLHRGAQSTALHEVVTQVGNIQEKWINWLVYDDPANAIVAEAWFRSALAQLACMSLELVRVMGGDPRTELVNTINETMASLEQQE